MFLLFFGGASGAPGISYDFVTFTAETLTPVALFTAEAFATPTFTAESLTVVSTFTAETLEPV